MIECSTFDLDVSVTGDAPKKLTYRYWTDLPAGTKVSFECFRVFRSFADQERLWLMHSELLTVGAAGLGDFNGGSGELDLRDAERYALANFEEGLTPMAKGMKTPPGDDMTIRMVVGARQPLKAFGAWNKNLMGAMVLNEGGVNIVRATKKVAVPVIAEFLPFERWD